MKTTEYHARLLQQRTQLLARYRDEMERADEELASRDRELVENATETWDAQVLGRLGASDLARLDTVLSALGRIEDGTFGICARCELPVGEARLQALPTAEHCITCANAALEGSAHTRAG